MTEHWFHTVVHSRTSTGVHSYPDLATARLNFDLLAARAEACGWEVFLKDNCKTIFRVDGRKA